jgi:hypothetical protein
MFENLLILNVVTATNILPAYYYGKLRVKFIDASGFLAWQHWHCSIFVPDREMPGLTNCTSEEVYIP